MNIFKQPMGYCQLYKKNKTYHQSKEIFCAPGIPSFQVEEETISAQKAYVKTKKKFHKAPINQNKFCYECKLAFPKFVSVNNGIYICIDCATVHREFGDKKVSWVRSLEMDNLTPFQLKMLEKGGNAKFREFVQKYDI